MSETTIPLSLEFEDGERAVVVPRGHRDLASALRRAGFPLNTRCGGIGLCDGCCVEPRAGRFEHRHTGLVVDGRYAGTIRACQYRLLVGIDARVRIQGRHAIAAGASAQDDFDVTAHNQSLRPLWREARDGAGWCVEEWSGEQFAATARHQVPTASPLGLAIDIGTTTVAVLLVDLQCGAILDRAADFNRQIALGDDVITRISLCGSDPTMLRTLQQAVVEHTMLPLVMQCLERQSRDAKEVVCAVVSGNTTMLHLLAGIDPTPMGRVPFRTAFLDHRVLHDLFPARLSLSPTVHLLPGVSAYVGSDLAAGMIACGIEQWSHPSLLVDVGTNGEMILASGERIVACATAAGPAFEGSGLSSGVRASDGAVSHIQFLDAAPWFKLTHIGNARATGLCGSFYVDFLAETRRVGMVDHAGHFDVDAVPALASRFAKSACSGMTFRISGSENDDRAIVVSEADLAKLLAAKAAIAAGLLTILEREGLKPTDIRNLYLAGGFGAKVIVENAIACGLLPGFTPSQIRVVGNSSLAGALAALLDVECLQQMRSLAKRVEVIELNLDPGFEDRYLDNLRL